MAIVEIPVRAVCAGAFAAAIVIAPVVWIAADPGAHSRSVADVCSQVSTNGSVSLQCGTPPVGGPPGYTGGCVNAYGQYQNCIVHLLPPSMRH